MDSPETADLYDAYYYATGCGPLPYERNEAWLKLADSIAARIVTEINPRTVLDVGCGMGFLVETLRRRGVEAFGLDVSDYAIRQVHPDIQAYCWVGSATTPFGDRYDLLTCVEVLEHLPASEAAAAIKNLCQHSDDILFSSTPFDYQELTHFNVRPPEYWAELFAQHGFFRDVEFDASFLTPWAARFRKVKQPAGRVIATYERRLWQLLQENQARRAFGIEQRNELSALQHKMLAQLAEKDETIRRMAERIAYQDKIRRELEASPGWGLVQKLQQWRAAIAPPRSTRDQALDDLLRAGQTRSLRPLGDMTYRFGQDLSRRAAVLSWKMRLLVAPPTQGQVIHIAEIGSREAIRAHRATVDIIICVHNALADVQRCLESLITHTAPPYQLILVDDGSDIPTRNYLAEFAGDRGAILIRNETARGYTLAANQGLRAASADYALLLNSDTIVTPNWLDGLVACAESDPRLGIIGPLSNTASWQSIPEIEAEGDWAANLLPDNLSIDQMGELVARYSARLYPPLPFLNGFCLLIRRQLLQEIGYFDEENFGAGYGEENDYALRAGQAGWNLAVADNVYVYHAQSRSYSSERRQKLSQQANNRLIHKHGQRLVDQGVAACRRNRVLEGIRTRSVAMLARQDWLARGRAKFAGRRVLFVLPIFRPGGGANVVIDEALAMRHMGVDARLFNLTHFRQDFERSYPQLELPVLFGEESHLPLLAQEYDALIATFHASVTWLAHEGIKAVRGYYIQDFEPYMYSGPSTGRQTAWDSYTLIPDLVRFTKTEWTRQELKSQVGVEARVIGVSANLDLFRPRPRRQPEWPRRPLRVAAMVRADSPHRAPELTMRVLRQAAHRYRAGIEVMIFGTALDDPGFAKLPANFAWKLAGVLNQKQVANFLNEVDIFVDFSSHQAMGLTALEAMACGAAVIVPEQGGATSFARHEQNSLVIDTGSEATCLAALCRLIDDHELRGRLQDQAVRDVGHFFPERPAFNILQTLFEQAPGDGP